MTTSLCFYSGVRHPRDFDTYPWYAIDVQILQELGFNVHVSKRHSDISFKSDVYLAWWPTTGIVPLAVATVRRKPFVLIAAGDDIITQFPGFGYWERSRSVQRIVKTTVRRADHVLAISQHAAEQARALGAKRVSVVYLGIDANRFSPKADLRTTGNCDFLCTVAKLNRYYLKRKPLATLVRALPQVLARYPATRLLIIGRPDDGQPELQRLASELNVLQAVQFLGSVSVEEKVRHLQSAFAYIQPTIHENFGVAIAEAMSCGLPVVTTPVAAVPEVVGDCGLLADSDDADGFARHMLHLLDDPDSAADMGRRARQRIVDRFTVADRRRGFEKVLSQIV